MTIRLGVVMDPIASIHYKKDSTFAMLWEAQNRNWEIYFFEQKDLHLRDSIAYGFARTLQLFQDESKWFAFKEETVIKLADLDVILMRKDPPFNEQYIYTTYILEQAERQGTYVVNRPQSLRDANEKLFATYFPQCCPPNLVTQSVNELQNFWREHHDIVCKPLNTMGGISIFRIQEFDVNANVIFETLTQGGKTCVMAQKFIPEIVNGDKRILLIDGKAIPHVLARIPQGQDWRGNLAVGAKGSIQPISAREQWICDQLSADLRKRGLIFVGIDVIGDYLTEINVTSPTGIRELMTGTNIDIASMLMDVIESKIS